MLKPDRWCSGACLDIFGVFDGHGGTQSAMYASKSMMPAVLKELSKATQEEAPGIDIHGKHAHASLKAEGKWPRTIQLICSTRDTSLVLDFAGSIGV